MVGLRENQVILADTMDINMTAMERNLQKLGLSEEAQKAILDIVMKEFEDKKLKKNDPT
jgi:hypothetical protein